MRCHAARRFFERAIGVTGVRPIEVVTDRATTYSMVLEELLPGVWHRTDRYANNGVQANHGRLKARLGPMRSLNQDHSARVVIGGHALVQKLRRGHYELAVDEPPSPAVDGRVRRAGPRDVTVRPRFGVSVSAVNQMQQPRSRRRWQRAPAALDGRPAKNRPTAFDAGPEIPRRRHRGGRPRGCAATVDLHAGGMNGHP